MVLDNFYYQFFCVLILGLIMGSFYNVVILRTLSGESLISPPSKCPKCQTKLEWWQNIPIVSYFLLKGKCHFCKTPIDIQYPIVEILSAILFGFSYLKFGLSLKTIFCISILSFFLILSGMDIKEKIISYKDSIFLIMMSILFNYTDLLNSILGALLALVLIGGYRKLSTKFFDKEVIGEGDIYILTALGGLVGINHLALSLISVLFFQFLFCIPIFIKNTLESKNYNILYFSLWFGISYSLLFLTKIYVINPEFIFKALIFVNVFVSLVFICKYLISHIKNAQISTIEPVSPAVFLSAFLFLFLL